MKTKILIVTYYWPPSGGPGVQRHLKFAKYLPKFNIEPIILTVKNPTYPIKDPSLEKEVAQNVKVYKTKTIEPFGIYAGLSGKPAESIKPTIELKGETARSKIGCWIRGNIFIPDARVGWILTARKKARELVDFLNISTVITTGPPHSVHFIGKFVREKTGVQWIADFRDPWSQIYYNQILPRTKYADQIDKIMESNILNSADEVVTVTPFQAKKLSEINERNYRIIPNGFDHTDFDDLNYSPNNTPPYIIRHIGCIGCSTIPVGFLHAVKELAGKIQIRVEFIGEVNHQLPEIIKELELEDTVFFNEYQPHQRAIKSMCSSDILLLSVPDVEQIQHHIPGKLYEYIGSGRPVFLLGPPDGDAAKILEKENAGITCKFDDTKTIKNELINLIGQNSTANRLVEMKNHTYSRVRLTEKLSQLILSNLG